MTEQDWLTSEDPVKMLQELTGESDLSWHTKKLVNISARKLRLFACACCRQVWHLLTDEAPCPRCGDNTYPGRMIRIDGREEICPGCKGAGRINRSRNAVEVAERYADGLASDNECAEAHQASQRATWHTGGPFSAAAFYTLGVMGPYELLTVSRLLAESDDLGGSAPYAAQAALLREVAGNPFRPVTLPKRVWTTPGGTEWLGGPCPWLTPTVLSLARAAYDERRRCPADWWSMDEPGGLSEHPAECECGGTGRIDDGTLDPLRLAVLADALEEAGCSHPNGRTISQVIEARRHAVTGGCCSRFSDQTGCDCLEKAEPDGILAHLRSAGVHVRGSWALDLILGKE